MSEPIVHTFTVTFTVTDPDAWANEYGVSPAEVDADVATYFECLADVLPDHLKAFATMTVEHVETPVDSEAELLSAVRATIEADEELRAYPPVKVVLLTSEWDNGFFLSPMGTAHFADGSQDAFFEIDGADEPLADLSRAYGLGRTGGAKIDLTGEGSVDVREYLGA